jgi:hypothetical protein
MDPLRLLVELQGFFTRAEARECGYSDKAIAAMVRGRAWLRFRRGYYTFPDIWDHLDAVGRHRVRSRAVLHSLGGRVALSHVSAAIEHGVNVWGVDLDRVHVTRLDAGPGRVEGDVVHHEGICPDADLVSVNGLLMVVADRAVVEAATRATDEAALVMFDSYLHDRPDDERLMPRFRFMERWPMTRHLHIPIRLADGGAESPGESRARWLCWVFRLPVPMTQYEVRDSDGVLHGTCDFYWPRSRTLGEFDGRVKYGRLLTPGQDPGDAVFAEKVREDKLREVSGASMIRLIWRDYERPRVTAARIERFVRPAFRRLG